MYRKTLSIAIVVSLMAIICATGSAQRKVTIAVIWSGPELETFQRTLAPFEEKTGIDVVVESVGRDLPAVLDTRVAAGNPPDVAALPNPGQMKEFAEQGALVPLDDLANLADHPTAFVDLGSVNGHVYGVFLSADLKSLVWYNPKAFAAKGYEVPTSWAALIDLSNKIVADGGIPWAIGMECGAASGWVGTDWIEDIMLRTAGPDLYDKWVNHEIAWTHPAVKKAWEYFGQIVGREDYVYGGATGALTINFGDSPNALFTNPPGAYMHRQATFIQSFIRNANPNLKPVEDYNVFVFPPISPVFGNLLLGAGDLIGVFNDTPETKALADYLASAEAQEIWCGELGKLAINKKVDPAIYPDPITAKAAEMLAEAETFRFDGSDLMPPAVDRTFWSGVLDYINGISLNTVLECIEASAIEAYGSRTAKPVLEQAKPVANFTFSPSEPAAFDPIVFTDCSSDPDGEVVSWHWDFGNGDTSTKQNPIHHYTRGGTFTVILAVTDNDGLTDQTTQAVFIEARDIIQADFTFQVVDEKLHKVHLDASASIDTMGTIVRYEWDWDGDGVYDTAVQTPAMIHRFEGEGPYQVILAIVDDQGNRASCTKEVAP